MMNNEEIERKMNFIVEQQAQFATDIQKLQESQTRTEQVVAHTTEAVAHTAETVSQVTELVMHLTNETHKGFSEVNAKINALVDSQIRTEEHFARTDEKVALTTENLNNLIALVDRHLREGRNGKSLN